MSYVVVATIEGKDGLHFLKPSYPPDICSIWVWNSHFQFAHRFASIHDAAQIITNRCPMLPAVSIRIVRMDKIKAEIEAAGKVKFYYVIKRTIVHSGAEIIESTDFEKFVFVHASMAEYTMFTAVAVLKKKGFAESYRNQSEDGTYIAATHLFKNNEQIKLSIERIEVVEKK